MSGEAIELGVSGEVEVAPGIGREEGAALIRHLLARTRDRVDAGDGILVSVHAMGAQIMTLPSDVESFGDRVYDACYRMALGNTLATPA